MKGIENRLVYLFSGEFFAVVAFTLVYFYQFSSYHSYSLMYTLFVLNFILLQGSFFWVIKWRRMRERRTILPNLNKFFLALKKINLVLICIGPFIVIIDKIVDHSSFFILWLALIIYVFTIIEYINYFHIQLTNYKDGKGKKSTIAKDIERMTKKL
ncbi:hypothetical protein [Bacillus marasmi]|uniref:hypothetical protein n=1 Tax=Bacillus marasmi TaxID=1926279 RepID=UPI0011C88174|nr:hypothetical protein [Bacillus marasmi]